MLKMSLFCFSFLALMAQGPMAQENEGPKVNVLLKGSMAEEGLATKGDKVIYNSKKLEELWKAWNLDGKPPEVDFKKEIVFVETTRGSRLSLRAILKDGDLQVLGLATRDLGPGFRFVIASVSRKGVKTVKGKEIPQE